MKGKYLLVNKNRIEIKNGNDVMDLILAIFNKGCIINNYSRIDFFKSVNIALDSLLDKYVKVINMKYGLNGERKKDLYQIAADMNLTEKQIKIIVGRAYQRMRKNPYSNDFFRVADDIDVIEKTKHAQFLEQILRYELSQLAEEKCKENVFISNILKMNRIDEDFLRYKLRELKSDKKKLEKELNELYEKLIYDKNYNILITKNISPKLLFFLFSNGYSYLEKVVEDYHFLKELMSINKNHLELLQEFNEMIDDGEKCIIYPLNKKIMDFVKENDVMGLGDLKKMIVKTSDEKLLKDLNEILGLSYYL